MQPRSNLLIPGAIVIAALIIGGSWYFSRGGESTDAASEKTAASEKIRPLSEDDYILGNPEAPIVIVEYTDLECPFCKQFHDTMHRLIDEYGRDGTVAWALRHLPVAQLHSKAPTEALAAECVGSLGGNDAFWSFVDQVFATTQGNDSLDLSLLPTFAQTAGVNQAEFQACMDSKELFERVAEDANEAIAAGATGTPFNIILVDGAQYPVSGAQPYGAMKTIIDTIIAQREAGGKLAPPSL